MGDYVPIACHFYDMLEDAAVRRVDCTIIYEENGEKKQIQDRIVDFLNINKEEFLVMNDGTRIRLDKIKKLNDISAPSSGCNTQ